MKELGSWCYPSKYRQYWHELMQWQWRFWEGIKKKCYRNCTFSTNKDFWDVAGKKDEEVQVFQLEYLSKVRFRRVLLHDKVGYSSVLEVDLPWDTYEPSL